jgi:hypothetical protein
LIAPPRAASAPPELVVGNGPRDALTIGLFATLGFLVRLSLKESPDAPRFPSPRLRGLIGVPVRGAVFAP